MRKLIAGNWKMNGVAASLGEISALETMLEDNPPGCDILICPPATLLSRMRDAVTRDDIWLGGQDCHMEASGAHTGDISAAMLADAGGTHVIVGHSERRSDHGEISPLVQTKALAALDGGLVPVICVGETFTEYRTGKTVETVLKRLEKSLPHNVENTADVERLVVGYEPRWAIGTGLVPKPEEIATIHAAIRERVGPHTRILYGGSMTAANAGELLSVDNVDGGLIGGASLKAADFHGIIAAAGRD